MAERVSQFTFEEVERKLGIVKDNQGRDKCLLGDGTYGNLPQGTNIVLDETPTEGSDNAVKSKGVYSVFNEVNNKTTQNAENITNINRNIENVNTTIQNITSSVEEINEEIESIQNNVNEIADEIANSAKTYNKYVVFAVAGQSNAVGYDESPVDDKFIYANRDTNRIKQLGFYGEDNLKLIDLGYCAQNMQDMRAHNRAGTATAGTKGIHLPLANLMLDYIPDDYGICVLPIAFGGTGFTSGNAGDYSEELKKPTATGAGQGTVALKWGVDTAYYKTLRDRIIHALTLNEENLFAGIVWCQGENDKTNVGGHYTGFQAMTEALFNALNEAGLGGRTPKGTFDKDIWYNYETVSYWYNAVQCQQIWNNYKTWNPKTFVEIPRDTESNAVNGTGQTASNRPDHYGNNAYQKVVAPRVLQKMIDMNTFAKKVDIVDTNTSNNSGSVNIITDASAPRAVNSDVDITTKGNLTFSVNADDTCSADQDIQGKFALGTNEVCVSFGDIAEMEWTVTRQMYWMIINGDITGNYLLLGLGGNTTGQLAKIENGALTIVENANTHTAWHYSFKVGDKIRVYRNFDGSLSLYRTNNANGKFQLWFEHTNRNIYEKKLLGFACGIAASEFNSPFNTEKRILFSNMRIKEELSLIDYKTYELALENLGVKDTIFNVTLDTSDTVPNFSGASTNYTTIKSIVDAGGSVYLKERNTNKVLPMTYMDDNRIEFTMDTDKYVYTLGYYSTGYMSTLVGSMEKPYIAHYTVNVTESIMGSDCAVIANASNARDFVVFREGQLVNGAKFLYLKKSNVKWGKANSAWSETPTDELPDKFLCLHDAENGINTGTYSYILI